MSASRKDRFKSSRSVKSQIDRVTSDVGLSDVVLRPGRGTVPRSPWFWNHFFKYSMCLKHCHRATCPVPCPLPAQPVSDGRFSGAV